MKIVLLAFITTIMVFSGCKDNPVSDYGSSLSQSLKKSQDVALQAELSNIKKAIMTFTQEKGRLPSNIEEIKAFMGKGIEKEKFSYNPELAKFLLDNFLLP